MSKKSKNSRRTTITEYVKEHKLQDELNLAINQCVKERPEGIINHIAPFRFILPLNTS